jgi:hypothetical protein
MQAAKWILSDTMVNIKVFRVWRWFYFLHYTDLAPTETPPNARVLTNRMIKIRPLRQAWSVPEGKPKILYLLWAPFKALFVAIQLLWMMGGVTQYPDFIFMQVSINLIFHRNRNFLSRGLTGKTLDRTLLPSQHLLLLNSSHGLVMPGLSLIGITLATQC